MPTQTFFFFHFRKGLIKFLFNIRSKDSKGPHSIYTKDSNEIRFIGILRIQKEIHFIRTSKRNSFHFILRIPKEIRSVYTTDSTEIHFIFAFLMKSFPQFVP